MKHSIASSSPWESQHPLGKHTVALQKFLLPVFACPVSRALIPCFLQLTQKLMHSTRARKGYLFTYLRINQDVDRVSQKEMSKCWVSTGGLSTAVFLQEFAQRRADHPGSQGHLSSCSAALKTASLRGSKEVKESREPAYDGCSCPHTDGLQLWAGHQRLNRVPMHFCKAHHLHGHPPSAAPTVWFEARELQPWLKERRALLQPPAIHLPQKMPPGKFSLPHSTKQQRNFISSKIHYVSCKNRFWNRKRLIITLLKSAFKQLTNKWQQPSRA